MSRLKKISVGAALGVLVLGLSLAGPGQVQALTVGTVQGGSEAFGCSSYIAAACADLAGFGHTLVSTPGPITPAFLAGVQRFYFPLVSSLSGAEITALVNYVDGGGSLFLQHDHGAGSWFGPGNALLGAFGFGATEGTCVASDTHTIVGGGNLATTPNAILGNTITGSCNSIFTASDLPAGAEVFLEPLGGGDQITGVLLNFGDGVVLTTTDIDMWASGYADPDNRLLWQNIWALQGTGDAPGIDDGTDDGTGDGSTGVPLPASLVLLAIGLAGCGAARRLRKA